MKKCNFFFKKVKEINLEILANGKRHTFVCVLLQILFNYLKNQGYIFNW
jgi:hypothetical protein